MAERIYVALDLETTGLDAQRDSIIEIGAVRFQGEQILERFVTFVNPQRPIPLHIQQITGIKNADVSNAPVMSQVVPELLAFVGYDVAALVAHNASFDLQFLRAVGVDFQRPALDTFELASFLLPGMASYSLGELCKNLGIVLEDAHRALDDTVATAHLFMRLQTRLRALSPQTIQTILICGQEVDWPPLLLFEDAAQGIQWSRFTSDSSGQTDIGESANNTLPAEHVPAAETAVELGASSDADTPTASLKRVDIQQITAMFGADGSLAQQMGPRYETRAGQIEMAERVMQALNQGEHLLIEAGTGIGKSLAYLIPAAYWSLQNQRRVVIATNTIPLQDQLLDKDIPQVQQLIASSADIEPTSELRAALLKGRSHYLCLRRLRDWYRSHRLTPLELRVLAKVLVWLPTTQTGDASELFLPTAAERAIWQRMASDSATCTPERCLVSPSDGLVEGTVRDFYFAAKQRAEDAHILIINHALLLADLSAGGRIIPTYDHLIVDEAHHLDEAATDQLTYHVEWRTVQSLLQQLSLHSTLMTAVHHVANQQGELKIPQVLRGIAQFSESIGHSLNHFAQRLVQFVLSQDNIRRNASYPQRLPLDDRIYTQPDWSQFEVEWDDIGNHLQTLLVQLKQLIDRMHQARSWWHEPHRTRLFELQGIHEQLAELKEGLDRLMWPSQHQGYLIAPENQEQGLVHWMVLSDKLDSVSLHSAPIDIGEILEQTLLRQKQCAIFTGATLRTGSGFDFIQERLGLWNVTTFTVTSPFNYKQSTLLFMPRDLPAPNQPKYQQAVEQAIIAAATASQGRTLALFTSYAHLRTTADAIRTPLDRLDITLFQQGSSSRRRLLSDYRQAEKGVLLGTRTFWEGIDLPGDALLSLLIVRLPFAVPDDPLIAARSAELENPFKEYMLPDAALRFRQGFGRLIRRADDRGVVVLLDSRVWEKWYGQSFLDALPTCTIRHAPLMNLQGEIEMWLANEQQ